MTEFNTGLPSVRLIQKYIKDQQKIVIQLASTEKITGQVLWQDPVCLCVADESNQSLLIWKQGLIYIKPAP